MKMWKRTLSFLMAVFMVVSMLPISVYAEDGEHEHFAEEEIFELEVPVQMEAFPEEEAEAVELTAEEAVEETAEEAEEIPEETEAAEEAAEEVTEETEAAEEVTEEVTEETEPVEEVTEEVTEETEPVEEVTEEVTEEVAEETEPAEEVTEEVTEETEPAEEVTEEVTEETEPVEEVTEEVTEETEPVEEVTEEVTEETEPVEEVTEEATEETEPAEEVTEEATEETEPVEEVTEEATEETEPAEEVTEEATEETEPAEEETEDEEVLDEEEETAPGKKPVPAVQADWSGVALTEISTGDYTAEIPEGSVYAYFKLVPASSGYFQVESFSQEDTYGYIYLENGSELASDDDGGSGANFRVGATLTEGESYIIAIRFYNKGSGTIPFTVSTHEHDFVWDGQNGNNSYHYLMCSVCGMTNHEEHTYVNDVCTVCAYKFHIHDFVYVEGQYNDANYHYLTCSICGTTEARYHDFADHVCTVCGYKEHYPHTFEVLNTNSSQHDVYCTECGYGGWLLHEWDDDKVCTVCGYQGCKHVNSEFSFSLYEYHAIYCNDCGKTEYEPHTFENGSCSFCGYMDHDHNLVWNERNYINHNEHYIKCAFCSEERNEAHTNVNGTCSVCGFTIHAPHFVWNEGNPVSEWDHFTTCDCGLDTWLSHNYGQDNTCTVCGYFVHEHDYSETEFNLWNHTYLCSICGQTRDSESHTLENGICTVCGFDNNHKHNGVWKDGNSVADNYHYLECTICEMGYDEPHFFDTNETCLLCGYQVHTHNYVYDNYSYTNTHSLICTICKATTNETHVFENHVCTVCGRGEHYPHSFRIDEGWYNDDGHHARCTVCSYDTYIPHELDADLHCTACSYVGCNHSLRLRYSEYEQHALCCENCGGWFYSAHTFVDGYCSECNYRDHDHTLVYVPGNVYHGEHEARCPVCEEWGALPHRYKDGACVDCGLTMHSADYVWIEGNNVDDYSHEMTCSVCGVTTNYNHQFNQDDVCTVCGYYPHEHIEGFVEGSKVDVWSHTVSCTVCGMSLNWTRHDFVDGFCSFCGYEEHIDHDYVWKDGNDFNRSHHYLSCSVCGNTRSEEHTLDANKTCTVCGYMRHLHDFEVIESNRGNSHVLQCKTCKMTEWENHMFTSDHICVVCGYKEHTPHNFSVSEIYGEVHYLYCSACGYNLRADHEFDENGVCTACGYENPNPCQHEFNKMYGFSIYHDVHYGNCEKCDRYVKAAHIPGNDGNCTICGFDMHKPNYEVNSADPYDDTTHCLICKDCTGEYGVRYSWQDHTFNADKVCTVCGYTYHKHNYKLATEDSAKGTYNSYQHYFICTECGIVYAEEHTLNDKDVCPDCGYFKHDCVMAWDPAIVSDSGHGMRCIICNTKAVYSHNSYLGTPCICGHVHNYVYDGQYANGTLDRVHCADCGATDTISHMIGEDRKCIFCGAEGCEHKFKPTYTDATEHMLECTLCGFTTYGYHFYDENGDCVCGYKDHVHVLSDPEVSMFSHFGLCEICDFYVGEQHTYKDFVCEICGYEVEPHEHDWTEAYPYGYDMHHLHMVECKICYERIIEEHNPVSDDVKPTATSAGVTNRVICKDCHWIVSEGQYLPKLVAPDAPGTPSVSLTTTGVKVTWSEVENAAKYRVYYKTSDGSWTSAGYSTGTSMTVTGLTSGTKYSFAVRTYNEEGLYSDRSASKSITYIAAPSVSDVANTTTGVKVTWGSVKGAVNYRVMYKTSGGSWKTAGATTGTSMTVTGLTSGTKYYFTVRCVNKDNTSTTSSYNSTGKSITYIAAPSVSDVANTTTGVKVTWGSVKGAVNYRVMYKTSGGSWKTAGTTTGTSLTVKDLTSGTKYYFTVRCVNKDNTSTTSAYNTTGKSITYIAAPSVSAVANTTTGVKVTWGSVKGAVNYRVMYKTSGGSWKSAGATTGTSLTVKGLKSGTKYYFTVVCVNKDNSKTTSAYNTTGKSITYIAAPALPTVSNTKSGVKVTWTAVSGAAKYRVYYKTSGGTWKKAGDTTSTSYTVKGLKAGTKYYFTVACVSKDGTKLTSAYNTTGKALTVK